MIMKSAHIQFMCLDYPLNTLVTLDGQESSRIAGLYRRKMHSKESVLI